MGEVVRLHGALYAREFGYDMSFEALVAEIAAKFVRRFDPECERCWIAELDGAVVGSVFLVRKSPSVAKLRLLIVDPKARGLGLGRRLVRACIRFARRAGYSKLVLWTQSHLDAARGIYARAGFELVEAEPPSEQFGTISSSETWRLAL